MTPETSKPTPPVTDRLLTAPEVAEILQVSKRFVFAHARDAEPIIPHIRMGGSVRFRRSDIDAFIEKCARAVAVRKTESKCWNASKRW